MWSIVAEPQHLCGKAPLLWGSYDLDRLRCKVGEIKKNQKVVQEFESGITLRETAHWRQKIRKIEAMTQRS